MRQCNVFWAVKGLAASIILGYLIMYLSQKIITGILPKNEILRHTGTKGSVNVALNIKSLQTKQAKKVQETTYTGPNHDPNALRLKTDIQLERFNVILTFRIINDTVRGTARMKEYMWTLCQFLENRRVKHVHLMVDSQEEISDYFQTHTQKYEGLHLELIPNESRQMYYGYNQKIIQNGILHPKLVIHEVDSPDMVLTLHQFAFNHFQGEVVVITQADIILGEGFEMVDRTLLAGNRLLYSLSRHESKCGSWKDQCDKYTGSHDTFVFVPVGDLTEKAKNMLNHPIFSWGIENLVMYVYQHLLNYRILNPCKILRTYHYHCSNFRKYKKPQKWVNKFSEKSKPVDRLL